MAGRIDAVIRGAGVVVVAGVLAGGAAYVIQDDPGSPDTANIWIDTNGGTCTDSASLVEYADASACGSFDAAWDAAEAGDLIRVVAGTYAAQHITGDKASDTKIIGPDDPDDVHIGPTAVCDGNFNDTVMCIDADHVWLESMTMDPGPDRMTGTATHIRGASNVTYTNVNMTGEYPNMEVSGTNFTWHGGTWTQEDGFLNCGVGSEPVQIDGANANNAIIDGITFGVIDADLSGCEPHIEYIRINGSPSGLIIRNNYFPDGSDNGSGAIYHPSTGNASGTKIINNYFGAINGNFTIQAFANSWVFAYNTFADQPADLTGTNSTLTWVGNLGPDGAVPSCTGTRIKNVWGGSGSCGTDTFVGATDIGVDEATGTLEPGSPAIDAAETPGASDYCTDSAYVNSLDFEGTIRPQGSVCDAGRDEDG